MADSISSFWGPVTSSHEWYEKNYVYSSYVAEFYNPISNVPCIVLALIGLLSSLIQRFEKRFSFLHLSNMSFALGSVMYHATLQHVLSAGSSKVMKLQWYGKCCYTYTFSTHQIGSTAVLCPHSYSYMVSLLLLSIQSSVLILIASLCDAMSLVYSSNVQDYKYYIRTEDLSAKRVAKLYFATLFIASLCWLGDRLCCNQISKWPFNPQGHAWWHVFMGFNSYFANTFLMFCRAQQLEWNPKVVLFMGILPYVTIEKPKTQ